MVSMGMIGSNGAFRIARTNFENQAFFAVGADDKIIMDEAGSGATFGGALTIGEESRSSWPLTTNATKETSAELAGTIKYSETSTSSTAWVCMRTDESTYEWVELIKNTWTE